jgi:hypothetical protein
MIADDPAILRLVTDAQIAERALECALDLDPDADADGRLCTAARRARQQLTQALWGPGPLRYADTAAILPDGTVVCVCHQSDGLAIVPPFLVRRVGPGRRP